MFTTEAKAAGVQGTRFSAYDITLDLKLAVEELRSRPKEPTEMTLAELYRTIAEKRRQGEPAHLERVELHRKFSIAFACLVFAAVGVPLGIQPTRAVHSRGFSVSLVLIFVYYLLLNLGESLGERGALPAPVAVWLPNFVLSLVAVRLLSIAVRDGNLTRAGRIGRGFTALRSRLRPTSR